jgi:hypothetical protein
MKTRRLPSTLRGRASGTVRTAKAAAPKKAAPKRAAPKAAPKRSAPKAAPKRAAAPKKTAAPKRAAPVSVMARVSRLPAPANRQEPRRLPSAGTTAAVGIGGLGWLAAGAALLWILTRPSDAPAASLPTIPVKPPEPAPVPTTPTKPVAPDKPDGPIEDWSPDGKTLNHLVGYHRAKQSELNREIIALSPSFLKFPVGHVEFVTTKDGKQFAAALEGSHNNHPEIGPTNKGVSLFVKDT